MNNSIIEHRANYHYIQVCEEYLLICSHGKASPHCKALILSVLEQWTNTKRDTKQPLDSIYMTYPLWEQSLYYLYSRSTIIECLGELEKEKVITRTPHHTPNGKDTFAYGLAVERVQALIKALPDKGVKDLLPRLDAFKNAPRKTRVKKDASNSERETRVNLNDDASKNRRNVSSSTSSSHKESVVSPTLQQPNITLTPPAVVGDYENTAPSMQLSTATEQSVDNSHRENGSQSYSHKPATSVPTHVGVMPVLTPPMPPTIEGVKMPDAPQPPKGVRQPAPTPAAPKLLHTEGAIAICAMYEKVAGPGGYAKWDWDAMEEMVKVKPTEADIKVIYEALEGKKRNVEQIWLHWSDLATLKKNPARRKGAGPVDSSYHPELETDEDRAARDAKNQANQDKLTRRIEAKEQREREEKAKLRERRAN